jgi:hypothetical protein
VKDVFVQTYNVQETIFSDQTGQYPTESRSDNKYIMVMVEIDSNAILMEPMKSRKDAEMIRVYDKLVKRLNDANIHPQKHMQDNEISANMKEHIKKQHKFNVELVPPGNHCRNAAEVAIRILRRTSSVSSLAPPNLFRSTCGIGYCHKPKSHSTYSDNQMPLQPSLRMHICQVPSIITKCHWRRWDVRYRCMKRPIKEAHGLTIL